MKKKLFYTRYPSVLAVLSFVFVFFACSSDDNGDRSADSALDDFTDNYFGIVDAQFTDKNLPETNSDALKILSISGNTTVLAGGSNSISVVTTDNAKGIIVGIEGKAGYFTIPVGSIGQSNYTTFSDEVTTMLLLLGQGLNEDMVLHLAATDNQGLVGAYETLEITYMSAGSGALQVSLSWDQENDVDLHLIEPNGEEIYYGNSFSDNGGELDVDSNPACNIDNINNENIFYDSDDAIIEAGEYEVLVDLWANCDLEDNTNYTIVAHYNGNLITPTEGVNPHSGVLEPEDESHNSNLISVMKFEIPDESTGKSQNTANPNAPKSFKFNFKQKSERTKVLSPEKM